MVLAKEGARVGSTGHKNNSSKIIFGGGDCNAVGVVGMGVYCGTCPLTPAFVCVPAQQTPNKYLRFRIFEPNLLNNILQANLVLSPVSVFIDFEKSLTIGQAEQNGVSSIGLRLRLQRMRICEW